MKTIKLSIDDDIYEKIESELVVKGITGNLHSVVDALAYKIIKAINDKKEVLILTRKVSE